MLRLAQHYTSTDAHRPAHFKHLCDFPQRILIVPMVLVLVPYVLVCALALSLANVLQHGAYISFDMLWSFSLTGKMGWQMKVGSSLSLTDFLGGISMHFSWFCSFAVRVQSVLRHVKRYMCLKTLLHADMLTDILTLYRSISLYIVLNCQRHFPASKLPESVGNFLFWKLVARRVAGQPKTIAVTLPLYPPLSHVIPPYRAFQFVRFTPPFGAH